jgi:hypothetical protein
MVEQHQGTFFGFGISYGKIKDKAGNGRQVVSPDNRPAYLVDDCHVLAADVL